MVNTTGIRVLVVDDDERQREALGAMVDSLGFAAVTASNGRQALELHAEDPADLILTDLNMPGMDGFELLRNLEEHGDRTPTIVLTGFGSVEKAISVVLDLKAFWFLEKPVRPGILRALIDRAAAQGRLMEETGVLRDSAGGAHLGFRSDHGRKRHRQGAGGACAPSSQPPVGRTFCARELR